MSSDRSFNYSFAFWLYPRPPFLNTSYENIFHYGTNDSVRAPGVWANLTSLYCAIDAVNQSNVGRSIPLPTANAWTHVTITVNTDQVLMYTNGAEVGQLHLAQYGGRRTYAPQTFYGGNPFHSRAFSCHSVDRSLLPAMKNG